MYHKFEMAPDARLMKIQIALKMKKKMHGSCRIAFRILQKFVHL